MNTCFSIFGIIYIFMRLDAPWEAYAALFIMALFDYSAYRHYR